MNLLYEFEVHCYRHDTSTGFKVKEDQYLAVVGFAPVLDTSLYVDPVWCR